MPIDPSIALQVQPPKFNNPFEVLAHYRAQQDESALRQQQIRSGQAAEEARRQDIEKQRREEAAQQVFFNIVKTSTSPDEIEQRIRTEAPEMLDGYQKQKAALDEKKVNIDKTNAEIKKLKQQAAKDGLDYAQPYMQLVEKAKYDPDTFKSALGLIKGQFEDFPAEQLWQQSGGTPDGIKAIVDAHKSTAQQNADSAATTAAAELPGKTAQSSMLSAQAAGMQGGLTPDQQRQAATTAAAQAETARHNRVEEGLSSQRIGQEDSAISLTPEAKKMVAHQFAMTGQLPPMGMGKAGAAVRTSIINEAADIYKGLDLPSQVAAYNANKASLGKMQGQRDAVGAFEETALKNLDQFLSTAQKVVDTKSPWLNRPLRSVVDRALGSTDQAAFNTARQAVIPEFSKLLGNPSLSGQLTDSQRKEVDTILSPDATLAQIIASAKILKQDAQNRKTALDDGIKAIQDRIAKPPASVAAPAASSGTMKIRKIGDPSKVAQGPRGPVPAGWEEVK